jgi:putative ABC transport system substrate-binding protein
LYTFNNPDDNSSVQALAALKQTAPNFDIDLIIRDASTPEEITVALNEMPDNIDAIFLPASAFFEKNINQFVDFSNEHNLPLAAPATANVRDGALISFGHDNVPLGQQASRLADQILRGVKPTDLPIETADLFVSINLKTAETIELSIPDEIIRQADIVIR